MAVRNLVSNAVKYGGEEPEVVIDVRARDSDQALTISVEDRGLGISEQALRRLFEPFYRSPRARDLQIEGSGLGLSLVAEFAEAHGGTVEVDTRVGEGSRFTVVLPTERV